MVLHQHRTPFSLISAVWLSTLLTQAVTSASYNTSVSAGSNHAVASPSVSARSAATCASKEINYITHTLPQQCLRTSRATALSSDSTQQTPILASNSSTYLAGAGLGSSNGASQQAEETGAIPRVVATVLTNATAEETPILVGVITQQTVSSADAPAALATELAAPDLDLETESALDSAKFLSFEEWKKENLVKAGQSPEHLGQQRASTGEGRRRPVDVNALESLGEESEIDLDFAGFGSSTSSDTEQAQQPKQAGSSKSEKGQSSSSGTAVPFRGRDAGTTCKERFNYASFDCAATILKTNPKCKSSTSILIESKDSYMLNECTTDNKFTIVELCEDILVDTLVLANFEFFSSTFRTFRVSVSDRYPVKLDKWKILGTFEARNGRDIQAFAIENPLIWARYLRIEFLTHYGNEYYCPVSLLRVHGTTMMEEFRHQDDAARGDDENEESEAEIADPEPPAHIPAEPMPTVAPGLANPSKSIDEPIVTVVAPEKSSSPPSSETPTVLSLLGNRTIQEEETGTTSSSEATMSSQLSNTTPSMIPTTPAESNATAIPATAIVENSYHSQHVNSSISLALPSNSNYTMSSEVPVPNVNDTKPKPPISGQDATQATASTPSPVQQVPSATPTTQESFYKTVHKRLQMLESNSSLSLQYIEEQSRILRDAFAKVEKRQTSKTERFLDQLNSTVLAELKGFRQQYDQLWQSTVIELESHRERHQAEMDLIAIRLTVMTDELVWQKRVSVAQSSLLLFFVFLVVFVRTGTSALGLELPLMQQMLNKSPNVLRLGLDSPPGSPDMRYHNKNMASRPQTRSSEDTEGGSSPIERDGGIHLYDSAEKPRLHFSPATPTGNGSSHINGVDGETEDDDDDDDEEHMNGDGGEAGAECELPLLVRQTQSGPTTPSGRRDQSDILEWDVSSVDEVTINGSSKQTIRKVSPLRHVLDSGDALTSSDERSGVK